MNLQLCKTISLDKISQLPLDKYVVEPKLDGVRAYLDTSSKVVTLRSGQIRNIPYLFDNLPEGLILDGEIIGDNLTLPEIAGNINSLIIKEGLIFKAFDILSFDGIDIREDGYEYRKGILFNSIPTINFVRNYSNKDIIPFIETEKLLKKEGVVLKLSNSIYTGERSNSWLKCKFTSVIDCIVVGFEEWKGKYKGKIGALILNDLSGKSVGNVGCLPDNLRPFEVFDSFWKNRIIEIEYLPSEGYSKLRHPRIKW